MHFSPILNKHKVYLCKYQVSSENKDNTGYTLTISTFGKLLCHSSRNIKQNLYQIEIQELNKINTILENKITQKSKRKERGAQLNRKKSEIKEQKVS